MIADGGGMFARVSRAFFVHVTGAEPSANCSGFFFVAVVLLACSGTLKVDGMKKSPGDTFRNKETHQS